MTFALADRWVWDFWLARVGLEYHLYYLSAPKNLGDQNLRHRHATIGHAVSSDLTVWTDRGIVLGPGEKGAFDETATWTGSVVQGGDGLWRMFYTGTRILERGGVISSIEAVGVATSQDLHSWTKRPGPVSADPRWYETREHGTETWRDPWVFPDSASGGWQMLLTARSRGAGADRGVIGRARSADLEHWTVDEPVSAPGAGFLHLEVPQVASVEGRGLLLFSCDTAHLAGASRGRGGGVWALPVDGVDGPFDVENAVLLTGEELYSGRVVDDPRGNAVLLAFENVGPDGGFGGRISDPTPISWTPEGMPRLTPPRRGERRRTRVG